MKNKLKLFSFLFLTTNLVLPLKIGYSKGNVCDEDDFPDSEYDICRKNGVDCNKELNKRDMARLCELSGYQPNRTAQGDAGIYQQSYNGKCYKRITHSGVMNTVDQFKFAPGSADINCGISECDEMVSNIVKTLQSKLPSDPKFVLQLSLQGDSRQLDSEAIIKMASDQNQKIWKTLGLDPKSYGSLQDQNKLEKLKQDFRLKLLEARAKKIQSLIKEKNPGLAGKIVFVKGVDTDQRIKTQNGMNFDLSGNNSEEEKLNLNVQHQYRDQLEETGTRNTYGICSLGFHQYTEGKENQLTPAEMEERLSLAIKVFRKDKNKFSTDYTSGYYTSMRDCEIEDKETGKRFSYSDVFQEVPDTNQMVNERMINFPDNTRAECNFIVSSKGDEQSELTGDEDQINIVSQLKQNNKISNYALKSQPNKCTCIDEKNKSKVCDYEKDVKKKFEGFLETQMGKIFNKTLNESLKDMVASRTQSHQKGCSTGLPHLSNFPQELNGIYDYSKYDGSECLDRMGEKVNDQIKCLTYDAQRSITPKLEPKPSKNAENPSTGAKAVRN